SRMRSTHVPTDGKSMATSSAKQSCGITATIGAAQHPCQDNATLLASTRIMPSKECPLCGGSMQLRESREVLQIPGQARATPTTTREWVCPDCDYFEEAEGDG